MNDPFRLRWLRIALVVCGGLCLVFWPLTLVWPSGWSWHPRHSHSEMMIVVFYGVLGMFLLRAALDPMRHQSLIWFMVWSSLAHGGIMTWQSLADIAERGHLLGDVPALLVGALALAVLMPRGADAERLAADPARDGARWTT